MTQQSGSTPFDFSGFIADRTKDFTVREWVFRRDRPLVVLIVCLALQHARRTYA